MKCNKCGGELRSDSDSAYRCVCCGNLFTKKQEDLSTMIKKALGEEKYANISVARQNLWTAMHEKYIDSSSCLVYARKLKSLIPKDYYANFAETANGSNETKICNFLNKSKESDMEMYADAVLDFMINSMTSATLSAVCAYIDRAYADKTSPEYLEFLNRYEAEAEKVESGIYELSIQRDVFLANSSRDIKRVWELCDYLENQGVSCFVSIRNLRHGRGAAENYDDALHVAMDNCRVFVFVSSKNSRNL
ncbi:MAG: toll/interleukin-1 receptor domain-containing protein, partial [Clostridia bacterium]|nr:toll/interleukin-1 receptor domain-containing protein [Clostridia bacterium]